MIVRLAEEDLNFGGHVKGIVGTQYAGVGGML